MPSDNPRQFHFLTAVVLLSVLSSCAHRKALIRVLPAPVLRAAASKETEIHRAPWDPPRDPQARREWFQARKRAAAELREMQTRLGTALPAHSTPSTMINPFQWTFIGPQPIVNGSDPFAGSVLTLAIDPHNSCTVYAGTYVGKLWKTTDCGTTWLPLSDFGPLVQIQSISLDPVVPNAVYVLDAGAIYKSSDGGTTWTELAPVVTDTTQGCSGDSFAVHPNTSGIWLIAEYCTKPNNSAIYRSADGGTTWTHVHTASGEITDLRFNGADGNYAYAAGFATTGAPSSESKASVTFVISSDSGNSWISAAGSGSAALPSAIVELSFVALAPAPSDPKTIYVRTESYPSGLVLKLFKTTDGGGTWTNLNGFPSDTQSPRTPSLLTVHPTNPNLVFAGGIHLYRSSDGGDTWQRADSSSLGMDLHSDNHAMVFTPDLTRAYESNDGGVWTSSQFLASPIDWTNLNSSFGTAEFYPGVSIDPNNPNRTFGGTQDNSTVVYTGSLGWTPAGVCGDGIDTAIDPIAPSIVYAACLFEGIFRSLAGGLPGTWVQLKPPEAGTFLVLDPASPKTLYTSGLTTLFQTLDGGDSWHQVGPQFNAGILFSPVAIAPSDSNTAFLVTQHLATAPFTYVTTNALSGAASTWSQVPFGILAGLASQVVRVVVSPTDSRTVYALGVNSSDKTLLLLESSDGAVTWRAKVIFHNIMVRAGFGSVSAVGDFVIDPDMPSTLYLASDSSVFRSSDGGNSWYPLESGLPLVPVTSLVLHRASRTLRAGTVGRGAWDLAVPLTAPRLASVSAARLDNDAGFQLTAIGANFDANSVVRLNGSPLLTNFVSDRKLTAKASPASISPSTVYYAAVYKPGNGGGLSDPMITSVGPTIFPNGLQNAASPVYNTRTYLSNDFSVTLSPGEFVSLYGTQLATRSMPVPSTPWPTTLAGAKVLINDVPAPLSYVSPSQINFVVPWETSGSQATITVQVGGSTSNSLNLPIAAAPQIFTVNQQGFGQGSVLITGTSSLAAPVGAFPGSRPAKRGEFISIFATGLGPVLNQPRDGVPPDGLAVTTATPQVGFGCSLGSPPVGIGICYSPAQFSGLAPGFVGLYQINVQVPDVAIPGDAVPLNILLGANSNLVTIAVK